MVNRTIPGALALTLTLTLTLVGCPGGKDPKPESGEPTLAEFCASGADRGLVDLACGHGDPSLVSSMAGAATAACAAIEASVAAGRVVYRADLAKACADAWAGATCDTLEVAARACLEAEILAGTVPNGSACRDDVECANGHCRMEASCPGVCTAYVAADGICNIAGAECAPHLYCDSRGRCVAMPTPSGQQGQACVVGGCAPGLYCDAATSTCAPRKKSGSCADARDACAFGYPCTESGTCVAYAGRGERCGPEAWCGAGWACIDGTCGPAPAIGSPCAPSQRAGTNCTPGAYCDTSGTSFICRARKPGGAPCADATECQSYGCTAGRCEFDTCIQ